MAPPNLDGLRRLAIGASLLAIVIAPISTLAFLAAFDWRVEGILFGEPGAILGHGASTAAFLRRGAIAGLAYMFVGGAVTALIARTPSVARIAPSLPNSRTHRGLFGSAALLVALTMLVGACGSAPIASNPIASSEPGGTDPISVGPITGQPMTLDTDGDFSLTLSASEDADRDRARAQAGFAREVGPGWDVLSEASDEATDAAALSMAAEFAIDIPGARRNALFASVVAPDHVVSAQPASAAAALALLGAALAASQALGLGSLPDATVSESTTTTRGDSVATVTVNG